MGNGWTSIPLVSLSAKAAESCGTACSHNILCQPTQHILSAHATRAANSIFAPVETVIAIHAS